MLKRILFSLCCGCLGYLYEALVFKNKRTYLKLPFKLIYALGGFLATCNFSVEQLVMLVFVLEQCGGCLIDPDAKLWRYDDAMALSSHISVYSIIGFAALMYAGGLLSRRLFRRSDALALEIAALLALSVLAYVVWRS